MLDFSETKSYGYNKILKQYAGFPWYLPLPSHFEHGWTTLRGALKTDLVTNKPSMLVFSKRRAKAWKSESNIPVEIMSCPFILYRRMRKIEKKKDAKGTVAFASHSTYDLGVDFSIEKYCTKLKQLTDEFHPITVCLFWLDYVEVADIYRKHGFEVVTAGPKISNSLSFVHNFYEILSNHNFATANDVGSYTFFAVELGLPFFIYGEAPVSVNELGKDKNIGKTAKLTDFAIGRVADKLFATGPSTKITPEQKEFVIEEIGIDDCLTPSQMKKFFMKYSKKNGYAFRMIIWYWIETLVHDFIFVMPWVGHLMKFRKKLARRSAKKINSATFKSN